MTRLLDEALAIVSRLPAENQDDIARAMLRLAAGDGEPEPGEPSHLPPILQGLVQSRDRQFASDDEIEAAFRRFDA